MVAFLSERISTDDAVVAGTFEVVMFILDAYVDDVLKGVDVPPIVEVFDEVGRIIADMEPGDDDTGGVEC